MGKEKRKHARSVDHIAKVIVKHRSKAPRALADGLTESGSALVRMHLKAKPHRGITEGETLLHVAARQGAVELIKVLIGHGADVNAADDARRTPMHVAGAAAVRAMLAAAEAQNVQVDLKACDATGCSVDDAIWLALRDEEAEDDEQRPDGFSEDDAMVSRARAVHGEDYEGGGRTGGLEPSEEAWRMRLREEADFDLVGAGARSDAFDGWDDGGTGPGARCGAFDGWGDDDDAAMDDSGGDWFSEIAAAMAARTAERAREARQAAEAAAEKAWGAREAEKRRGGKAYGPAAPTGSSQSSSAAADAAERQRNADDAFRRVGADAEEKRRRAAQHTAHLAQREARAEARARYIARWLRFQPQTGAGLNATSAGAPTMPSSTAPTAGEPMAPALRMADVPWPSRVTPGPSTPLSSVEVASHVLTDDMDAVARRRALQAELRRWHPDKFVSRWGARLTADDAERASILLHVKQVAQCLNELMAQGGS